MQHEKNLPVLLTILYSIFSALLGVGIVVPLLPVYAHDLGATGIYIGMIFGSLSLSRTFALPYFGHWSDKKGRKQFIVAGLFIYFLVALGFLITNSVEGLIFIRFLQGIAAAMIMPVTQAYVAEISPPGHEGRYMGIYNMAVLAGLSIGPMAGGFISSMYNLDAAFGSMAIIVFTGFALSLLFLPKVSHEKNVYLESSALQWIYILTDKTIFSLFIYRLTYLVCVATIWCFLPVYADVKYALSGSETGILITLSVLVSGLLQIPMGIAADRYNKFVLIVAGGVIICVSNILILKAGGFRDLVWVTTIFGIGGGVSLPAVMAIAAKKGQETGTMGSVMATMTMAHSLGMLTGSIFSGFIMDNYNIDLVFLTGAILMGAGTLIFIVLNKSNEPTG